MLCGDSGNIKRGPALRIVYYLKNEVEIEYENWVKKKTVLKLSTWRRTKMYEGVKVLEECTVEDMVTLFEFEAAEKKEDEEEEENEVVINGVFAQFEWVPSKGATAMRNVEGWKEKIVEWIREEKVDGKKIKKKDSREILKKMKMKLVAEEDTAAFKKISGPTSKLLKICRTLPVHQVLEAAKAQKEAMGSVIPIIAETESKTNKEAYVGAKTASDQLSARIQEDDMKDTEFPVVDEEDPDDSDGEELKLDATAPPEGLLFFISITAQSNHEFMTLSVKCKLAGY